MLPSFYQACFQAQLSATQYLMLQMLVMLLQKDRRVTIERLATLFAQPIQFNSRRRSIQRFLVLPQLSIRALWFPVLKHGAPVEIVPNILRCLPYVQNLSRKLTARQTVTLVEKITQDAAPDLEAVGQREYVTSI